MAIIANRRVETETAHQALRADKLKALDPQQAWIVDYALSLCEAELTWLKNFEAQFTVA
jgi:hypothetical protein